MIRVPEYKRFSASCGLIVVLIFFRGSSLIITAFVTMVWDKIFQLGWELFILVFVEHDSHGRPRISFIIVLLVLWLTLRCDDEENAVVFTREVCFRRIVLSGKTLLIEGRGSILALGKRHLWSLPLSHCGSFSHAYWKIIPHAYIYIYIYIYI